MPVLKPLDEKFPIERQLSVATVLIDLFLMTPTSKHCSTPGPTTPSSLRSSRPYPSSAVASPHLFQKVAVAGICAA